MTEEFKGSILYELICYAEWKEEREEQKPLMDLPEKSTSVISRVNPASFIRRGTTIHDTVAWLLSLGPSWKYATTHDGRVIAILGSTSLETRSDRDNFSSPIGKNNVVKDLYPNFRCMAWNYEGSLLAVSLTNGQILFFDIMATQLFFVKLFPNQVVEDTFSSFSIDHMLCGLFFIEERVKKLPNCNELITVDRKGIVKSFRQTNADTMELHHEASFRRYYPQGTTAVTFSRTNSIILVCGVIQVGNELSKAKEQNLTSGISAWRLINDHPYYRIVFTVPQQEFRMDSRNLWKMAYSALSPTSKSSDDTIFRTALSPNGKFVAALHTTGTISVWHLPSLKLYQFWPLKSQFQYNAENSRFNNHWRVAFNRSRNKPIDPWRFHPFDINWWNNEYVIISRSNGCVSLCSVNDHVPSKNMLGDSPELFESPVYVSPCFHKGFFAFESDLKIKGEELSDSSVSDMELVPSNFWLTTLYQEILFWMTDSERFRPPRKRKRKCPTWIEMNRLFNVRSITPLELFYRKIEAEEYGEALDLAKVYNLDSDLVYQRRWTKHPVTSRTIKDVLAKITKRNWVLQECLERVPVDVNAARQLLEFGLKGTDLTAAVTISQGRDKGRFILWAADDLDISEAEYLSLIDRDNLEVKRLVGYRKQFLHFLDMLSTYEMILGGPHLAEANYDSTVYTKLRNRTVLESCIDMARNSDINGLKIMLVNHWTSIEPYYLLILSNFPETLSPYNYREFLPELNADGQVFLWEEVALKEKDWSDGFNVENPNASFYTNISYQETHTADYIFHWYEQRVRDIESKTGLTNLALALAKLGVERNITKIINIVENLETVEVLVYELKIEDMTLEKLERLSNIERLELLMSTATEETFVNNFKMYALPFLAHCERREPGSKFFLMNQYLTNKSQIDLKLPLKIFEKSKREIVDPIISDVCDLMKLAYNCIYACKSPRQGETILALLGCLPDRGFGISATSNKELCDLHDAIDELESHYKAVEVLEKYDTPFSLKEIQLMADDVKEIGVFFDQLCHGTNKKNPPMKANDWKNLLYDILELQKSIFQKFPVEKCYMTYVAALLRSGNSEIINLARNFLDKTPTQVETDDKGNLKITRRNSTAYSTAFALYLYLIPYEESLGMVLEAAEIYFDSASSYSDPDMELAKTCLNLMQNSKEPLITLMFDLIDAVKVLNKDFNLHILPQSVRRCHEKTGLLRKAMENIKDGYKKTQQLLKLATFLRIEELDQQEVESAVFEMTGDAAIAESDIKFCTQICHSIIAKGYHTGWKVFTQVAKYHSDPPILDHDTRLAFINYALNICPSGEIFEVLNAKYLIEIRSLQSKLVELSPCNSAIETAMLETQEEESIVHDVLNKMKLEEFLHTTTTWINPLKNLKKMAQVVKTSGGAILGGHRDSSFTSVSTKKQDTDDEPNENFLRESYPTFYISKEESPLVHQSLFAFKYNSFANSDVTNFMQTNPALELCLTKNRIWHLERLILGESEVGERDEEVLDQLIGDILPEDIPWGLSFLSSIEAVSTLDKVLAKIPQTQVSHKIILAYLAFQLQIEIFESISEEELISWNLNTLITATAELVKEQQLDSFPSDQEDDSKSQRKCALAELFLRYKESSIPTIDFDESVEKYEDVKPSLEEEEDDEVEVQEGDGWEDDDDGLGDGDGWESS